MKTLNCLHLTAAALVTFALSACGGSSGATAELNVMDAPPAGVTAVKVKIASMQVHVVPADQAKDADPNDSTIDNDSSWVSLDPNVTIDLVQHQGETAAQKLGELGLPEGKVTQIRIVLDTSKPENNTATVNGKDCNLGVAKVAKTGIKIDHVFKAFDSKSGGKVQAWVDFDLADSMTANKDGCYDLDPHLKLAHVKADGKDVSL